MRYVLTFIPDNVTFACHASTCSAARSTKRQQLLGLWGTFGTIDAARARANADAAERCPANEQPRPAPFRVCKCAKV